MQGLEQPKTILVKIKCRVSWTEDGQEQTCLCDDLDLNTFEKDDLYLKNQFGFVDNIFQNLDPQVFLDTIVNIHQLHSKSENSTVQRDAVGHASDYSFSDIEIYIEDGEGSNNFKMAYPNSEIFTKL